MCCQFNNVDLMERCTTHYTSRVKSYPTKNHFIFKWVNMKLTIDCYLQRATSFFSHSLVQILFVCWNVCHFSVSFSKVWDTYTCFSNAFLHIFSNVFCVDLFWIVVVPFWFAPEWELFRTQKCEKDKYSWISNFSYNIVSTKRIHNRAV